MSEYKYKAIPTFYNNIQFRSRLEARWAAFFDLMKWHYTYEPYDLEKWSPDFRLTTEAGNTFLAEVKPSEKIGTELRMKIGNATNFAKGILLITESPFVGHIPNDIGLTSVFGKTKNYKKDDDFEFCVSVISDLYGNGNDIINLCEDPNISFENLFKAKDFTKELWNEAGNIVQFLKPPKS
ncbi:hypothetical protein [Acetobacteroides hydrogenigenes]|uniref:Uncharacterized protein n=1 Tax=Acetobacteroides hydrogenigenes TaxID=979970 RepID=A0A4R2EQP3_9BACT|nr:hypothetical protein [Acetobacteroides hydrogenigenes]TCN68944.1 hypothetical protein CLV25_105146 [Acetobacteroides hydrogenigenes]